ncbi:acetolactate synthase-1/2/3 large subunit [Streptomyces africanus]|uniref:Acetolactate synthase-1/2/3 large subunit n=1 Tax=Streptomyces africanus TaxID=231024 RepID=A0ABU0QF06_9ACTN|nr:thiamine pyrophosphate-binding protein [Streptomyces africanus]MDQ0745976.1 acetolactate synthase-1/2/3 large subunit [Streptomyces africanus]
MSRSVTGGQLVVRMLESLGIRTVFGVPGGQTLALTDAILSSPVMDFVTARHENAAAVMADAYGRLTGTPGVCLATTGPGATNLLTGIGGAARDSSPVLVLTCNNAGENIHRDDAQNADHVELFRSLTKYSRLVAHAGALRQAVEEAYLNAMSGNPGPAHLDFARDTIEGPVADADAAVPEGEHPMCRWVTQRPRADAHALADVATRLAKAERPVLWLGNGCNRSGAGEAALALAESLRIPVITTFNGIGTVPTTHPLVFGALSRMGTRLSSRVMADADLVLAVGNSLNAVSTGRWRMELPHVIQIDVDPAMLGRYYGRRTTGVVADARATLEDLHGLLADRAGELSAARSSWTAELQQAEDLWWQERAAVEAPTGADGLSPAEVVRRLRTAAPDDTLLIPDAGNPGVWSYLWQIRQPGSYIKPVGFGNMGFAVPAAVAAVVADPGRPVLALVGDGSLGMSLAELETLVRVGGRVAVVVLNDSGYGNIRQEQIVHYGNRTIGVDFGPSDYAVVARGLGLSAERITGLEELAKRVGETLDVGAGHSPALFDVPIDQSVNAWTYPAFRPYEPEEG